MSGWISLHRKVMDHWIYADKPFDRRSAWIDLLFLANFRDSEFIFNKQVTMVKRGSLITSDYKLSERWGWTRKSVRNFLELLIKDNMITRKATSKYTYITITNYNSHQFESIRLETIETVFGTTEGTTETIDIKRFETCKGTTEGATKIATYGGNTYEGYYGTTENIDIKRFEAFIGTTEDTQIQGTTLEAHQGTTEGTTETIDIKRFEPYEGTTEGTSGGGWQGTHKNKVSNTKLSKILNNNKGKNPSVRPSVNKVSTVIGGEELFKKIIEVSEVDNYFEPTALFIKGVIKKLINDPSIAEKLQLGIKNEEIIERLRLCRAKHIEGAMKRMENCKTNKELYFAKCLLTEIVERGIEEIFKEGEGIE